MDSFELGRKAQVHRLRRILFQKFNITEVFRQEGVSCHTFSDGEIIKLARGYTGYNGENLDELANRLES